MKHVLVRIVAVLVSVGFSMPTPTQAILEPTVPTGYMPRISAGVMSKNTTPITPVVDEVTQIDRRHERSGTFTSGFLCGVSVQDAPIDCKAFSRLDVSFAYEESAVGVFRNGRPVMIHRSLVHFVEQGQLVEAIVLVLVQANQ